MIATFFDTETTGLAKFDLPSIAPEQPKLVQLAAKSIHLETWTVLHRINLIVYPDGWEIPIEASNVHGITTEKARQAGIRLENVAGIFCDLVDRSDLLVAHNIDYDQLVLERAVAMVCLEKGVDIVSPWPEHLRFACTKEITTPILQIPKPYRHQDGQYKWPSLEECSQFFFQRSIEGAHDAEVDVDACADVFYALWDCGHIDPLAFLAEAA